MDDASFLVLFVAFPAIQRGTLPDVFGIILLIASATLLAFGIVESNVWGWANRYVLWALLLGLVTLGAFIV